MASIFAFLAVAAIYLVALAPAVLAALRPGLGRFAALFYGASALAAATFQLGIFSRQGLAPYDIEDIENRSMQEGECGEVIRLLEGAGIIVDRRDPARLVVAQPAWDQMPPAVRDVATNCVERSRPEGANYQPIEIISR